MADQLGPAAGVVEWRLHHAEVDGLVIGEDDESIAPVVDVVLEFVLPGAYEHGRRLRVTGMQQPVLRALLAARVDHDPLAAAGRADPHEEAFVGIDEHFGVGRLRCSEPVTHHPVGALLFVGLNIEQVRAVARPGDPGPRGVVQFVFEIVLVGDVADTAGCSARHR